MFLSAANSLLHGQFQERFEGQSLLKGPTIGLIPPPSVDLENFLSNRRLHITSSTDTHVKKSGSRYKNPWSHPGIKHPKLIEQKPATWILFPLQRRLRSKENRCSLHCWQRTRSSPTPSPSPSPNPLSIPLSLSGSLTFSQKNALVSRSLSFFDRFLVRALHSRDKSCVSIARGLPRWRRANKSIRKTWSVEEPQFSSPFESIRPSLRIMVISVAQKIRQTITCSLVMV